MRKPPPFFLEKKPLKPHRALGKRADVEQIDNQEIARLGACDADRPGQEVHDGQIDVAHIVGRIRCS